MPMLKVLDNIRKVIKGVVNIEPIYQEDINGSINSSISYKCPFCESIKICKSIDEDVKIYDIDHEKDCVYVLANKIYLNISV
jgi:hypothetical protein